MTASPANVTAPHTRGLRALLIGWRERRRVRMYWIAPMLAVLAYFVAIVAGPFGGMWLRAESVLVYVILNATPLAFLAIGAGIVLASGGVDLSVAGVATFAGVLFSLLTHAGVPIPMACLTAVGVGCVGGLLLGAVVARSFPALISSWALGSLWTVAAFVVCTFAKNTKMPRAEVTGIGLPFSGRDALSPFLCVLAIAVVAASLNLTNLPRQAKAVGANRVSATYAGVRATRVIRASYAINGALAALAGIVQALLNSNASTADLQGKELVAIATAVLGGTLMTGGYLNLGSIACAAALWKLVEMQAFGLNVSVASEYQQRIVSAVFAIGILIIAWLAARAEEGRFVPGLIEPKTTETVARKRK